MPFQNRLKEWCSVLSNFTSNGFHIDNGTDMIICNSKYGFLTAYFVCSSVILLYLICDCYNYELNVEKDWKSASFVYFIKMSLIFDLTSSPPE